MIPTTTMTDCQKGVFLSCCERTSVYLAFTYRNGTIDSLVARAMEEIATLFNLPPAAVIVLKLFSGLALVFFGAWIAVWLSRNKFRSERWWEKKVEAYERIIDAFHKSKKFDSEHMRAEELDIDFDDARKAELTNQAKESRDEILCASDVGSFILSKEAHAILARYAKESENMERQNSWYEHLDLSWSITNRNMQAFIEEARADLKRKSD